MLDFRRLEAFCKVYELRSFSRAGADLFLSQPTISAHVLALEKELGVRLLDRMGRQVLPTPAGEVLYRRASEAFASLAAAEAEIGQLRDEVSGDLVIGGSTIPAHHVLPDVISRFVRTYPSVRVHLRVGDTADIVQRVTDGELMLGLVGAVDTHPDLVFEPLVDDELVVVATPELAGGRRHVQVEELAQWPWIMREAGSGTRRTFAEALAAAGMDVRRLPVALVVDSTQAVVQYVRAGLGISATSRLAVAESIARDELVELQLDDCRPARQFHSVRHARRHQFPAAAAFAAFLGEHTRHLRNGGASDDKTGNNKIRHKDKA